MSSGGQRERGVSTGSRIQTPREVVEVLGKISSEAQNLTPQETVAGSQLLSFVDTLRGRLRGRLRDEGSSFALVNIPVPGDIRHLVKQILVDPEKVRVSPVEGTEVQETKLSGLFYKREKGRLPHERVYSIVGAGYLPRELS